MPDAKRVTLDNKIALESKSLSRRRPWKAASKRSATAKEIPATWRTLKRDQ